MAATEANALPTSADNTIRVRADQIGVVFSASFQNLTAGLVAALIIAAAAHFQHGTGLLRENSYPFIWFGLLVTGLSRGLFLTWRFNKQVARNDPVASLRFGRSLTVNGALCAIVWGSTSWVLLPTGTLERDAFIILAIAMVLMGAAGAQAAYRPLAITFNVIVTGVFISGLLQYPDQFHLLMVLAFALYCLVTLMSASSQATLVEQQLRLQIEKEQLARSAEDARGIAEQERNAAEFAHARAVQEKAAADAARSTAETATEQAMAAQAFAVQEKAAADVARKAAENATEEAMEANRAKLTLLASAAHDLSQPLHSLGIFVADLTARNTDKTLANTVRRINSSVEAMSNLLDSMREFSLLSLGQVTPRLRTFDVSDVLERLDDGFRTIATDKGLRFIMRPRQVRTVVKTDERFLESILQNLTLNAIRYTDAGTVLVRCKPKGPVVSLQVWDTGRGIPRKELGRIFDAFVQIGNEGRDPRKGLGLGLAIVKQMCRLLGLRLRVRSVVGKGTGFTLEIPISTEPVSPLPDENSARDGVGDYVKGAFVISIDDNDSNREATQFALQRMHCRVLSAASTAEMLEKLQNKEFEPNLVLADYRLGDHSGIEAIRIITENLKAAHGPNFTIGALLISGDTSAEELQKVGESGFEMLHKPVHPNALYQAVNRQLKAVMESYKE